jgi:O-antigen/teichoic acid export membrane protein
MDFLHLADRSQNPAIVKAAIEMAREKQRHHQNLEKNISPSLAAALATIMVVAASIACWAVLTHYPNQMALEFVLIITTLVLLIICLYALFSGHLSQANFMTAFKWAGDRLKQLNPAAKPEGPPISSISANDDSDSKSS